MSVRIGTFKKIHPTETYASSALEIQAWAKGLADLRIEFGKQRTFQLDPRALSKPKIDGMIIASIMIDRQLKPALYFYPVPAVQYSEKVAKNFREIILKELRNWIETQLDLGDDRLVGTEMLIVELQGDRFKTHRVRYL